MFDRDAPEVPSQDAPASVVTRASDTHVDLDNGFFDESVRTQSRALSAIALSCSWSGEVAAAELLWEVARYLDAKSLGTDHSSELSALERARAALTVPKRGAQKKSPATYAFERLLEIVNRSRADGYPDEEILESALNDAWLYVHGIDEPTSAQRQAARDEVREATRRKTGVCDAETFARACLKAVGVARPDNVKSATHGKRARRKRPRS